MASASVQHLVGHFISFEPLTTPPQHQTSRSIKPRDVHTTLNYYKDPGDGSAPEPTYIGKPETYERPSEVVDVTVHDIRGSEEAFSLDVQGFQIHRHRSVEKDFLDDEQIKTSYYPETEQLLKDAYVDLPGLHSCFN